MPKTKISEYSSTANSNTDVASVNIDEGCAPSGINNAIRAVMGHLKDFQAGTNGDSFNGPVGTGTAAAGAFTTLSASGNVTLGDASSDTLNVGNGGLVKDASGNVGIGTSSPSGKLQISGATPSLNAGNSQLNIFSTDAIGADKGGRISFGGVSGAAGFDPYGFCAIAGLKDNATASNFSGYLTFSTATSGGTVTERARIDSSGNLLVGRTSGSNHIIASLSGTQGTRILNVTDNGAGNGSAYFSNCNNGGDNAAACAIAVKTNSSTGRSINAGGTVNASGADYAEYMIKAGVFSVAKGDVVGINADGKLTNVFADAVSFVVKSTNPSYVGGDTWGTGFEDDPEGLEAARQTVDRIAFAGQVPVNVIGATAGQYIIPVNDNGEIKGEAVSNPTFEQYQQSVGKVIAIEQDGRARIIVKVA